MRITSRETSPTDAAGAGGPAWSVIDTVTLTAVTLLGAALRFVGIGTPKKLIFDEFYYVPDACRYVIQIPDLCGPREFTYMHPPIGKWLIALGMQIVGPTRFGWRLLPALLGIATVVIVFLLARALLRSTAAATVAGAGLALDPLHLVHSRIAVLDIFLVFFWMLTILCAVLDRDDTRPNSLVRPWRIAAGAAGGAAVATKWAGAFALITVIALTLLWDRHRDGTSPSGSLGSAALWLLGLPMVVYALSYAGRLDGRLIEAFVTRHIEMFEYHTSLREQATLVAHSYSSPAWSWFLLKRPMNYTFLTDGTSYRHILATGNPAAWWPGLVAVAVVCARALRQRGDLTAFAIPFGFALAYGPWFFLTLGSQDPYFFYALPAVPFLYLALADVARKLWSRWSGRVLAIGLAVAIVGTFVFYYPLLTYRALTPSQWHARLLFEDCHPLSEGSAGLLLPTRTAPGTWCWI